MGFASPIVGTYSKKAIVETMSPTPYVAVAAIHSQ